MRIPLALALGAIPGALLRYFVGVWVGQNFNLVFPVGNFLVNLSGCFLMGFVSYLIAERWNISPEVRLLITTGMLGSYTTFSSYELDSLNLLAEKHWMEHFIYWIASPMLGLISFSMGATVAKQV